MLVKIYKLLSCMTFEYGICDLTFKKSFWSLNEWFMSKLQGNE